MPEISLQVGHVLICGIASGQTAAPLKKKKQQPTFEWFLLFEVNFDRRAVAFICGFKHFLS